MWGAQPRNRSPRDWKVLRNGWDLSLKTPVQIDCFPYNQMLRTNIGFRAIGGRNVAPFKRSWIGSTLLKFSGGHVLSEIPRYHDNISIIFLLISKVQAQDFCPEGT